MPIYEYQCLTCGTTTEVLQRLDAPPLAACPQCGGEVKKLISSPAFQFKGSGWYATDYAGKSKSGEEKSREEKSGEGKPKEKDAGTGEGGTTKEAPAAKASGGSGTE